MSFFSTFGMIVRTLLARKGRTFLTMLGIIIGVAGVIIIIALGAGAQSLVLGQVTKLGSNLISVQPGESNEKGPPAQTFGIVVTTLTTSDAQALRDPARVPHAVAVNAQVHGSVTVTWQNQNISTNFTGTDAYYGNVVDFTMQEGSFFTQQQDAGDANVVVLGSTVATELFASRGIDPIGQVVKVENASQTQPGGIPLRVIGVIVPRGSAFFQDLDDQIYLPLAIGQQQLLGIQYLQMINIKVDNANNVNSTIADATTVLDAQHHIRTAAAVDFTIRNEADAVSTLTTITGALSLFLTAMAAISLIVGGIGILNIMLVTVAERTREIGLRKAVGASNAAIGRQFLLEAGTLTSLGGIGGIIVGVVVSFLISVLMHALGYDWVFHVSLISVVLAVGVSVLTGVLFGLYPALQAAKLNPIEALRYE